MVTIDAIVHLQTLKRREHARERYAGRTILELRRPVEDAVVHVAQDGATRANRRRWLWRRRGRQRQRRKRRQTRRWRRWWVGRWGGRRRGWWRVVGQTEEDRLVVPSAAMKAREGVEAAAGRKENVRRAIYVRPKPDIRHEDGLVRCSTDIGTVLVEPLDKGEDGDAIDRLDACRLQRLPKVVEPCHRSRELTAESVHPNALT